MTHGTYGTEVRAASHEQPGAITCQCIDDPDLTRLLDLMAVGVSQRDASAMLWSPERARDLTWVETFRLGFREAFVDLTFPWVAA